MYFRQPNYFNDFKCIGGECKFTCCSVWNIGWSKEEIEKIRNSPDCSDELRTLVENSFEDSSAGNNDCIVKLNSDRLCPFLDKDGLCRIQKELGEEYLSKTCRIYPRAHRMMLDISTEAYNVIYRHCFLSCPEVAKRVITDPKAMSLVNYIPPSGELVHSFMKDSEELCSKYPIFLFRKDLFELFYDLISDKKYSVETVLIHGAIAAGILTEIVESGHFNEIPQAIKEIKDAFLKGSMFKEIDSIKPDYQIKVGFVGGVIESIDAFNMLNLLKTADGKIDTAKYISRERNLKAMFNGDDYWFRNIALNMLFELSVPLYYTDHTILENYSLFLLVMACFKLNAIASASDESTDISLVISNSVVSRFHGIDKIWGFAAAISRAICQSNEKAKKMINAVKDAKLTTPMQLALLIK